MLFSRLSNKSNINKAAEEASKVCENGTCFIAGTLVSTSSGLVEIQNIVPGDTVYSFNPETQVVSEQLVEETFVRESNELVHIQVGNETISATPDHPFYVPQKGFVDAIELRAGDALYTVNGKYVIVEQIQHEILELPVKVYNFRVANNHTYFVGNTGVGVHNASYEESGGNPVQPDQGNSGVRGGSPEKVNYSSKQLGKKFGEHMEDYPEFGNNYNLYKNHAENIFKNPEKIIYDKNCGEYYYIKGSDLLRIKANGDFVSLYPGVGSGRVIRAINEGGIVWPEQ